MNTSRLVKEHTTTVNNPPKEMTISRVCYKLPVTGAGEMAQWLRALAKDPGFDSQHLHGGSQPSVTPVPGDPMPSSGSCGLQAHTWCIDVHTRR